MKIGIPQAIYLALLLLGLGISLAKHGEYKRAEKYSFWTTLISDGIVLLILYYGGFFG